MEQNKQSPISLAQQLGQMVQGLSSLQKAGMNVAAKNRQSIFTNTVALGGMGGGRKTVNRSSMAYGGAAETQVFLANFMKIANKMMNPGITGHLGTNSGYNNRMSIAPVGGFGGGFNTMTKQKSIKPGLNRKTVLD